MLTPVPGASTRTHRVLSNSGYECGYLSRDKSPHRRTEVVYRIKRINPRLAGLSQCAREDSNFHGPIGPQGPQPCASTNSATGAGGGQYSPGQVLLSIDL